MMNPPPPGALVEEPPAAPTAEELTWPVGPALAPGPVGPALAPGLLGPSPLEQIRSRGRVRATISLIGPAFVAAVAYIDPGNFATNFQGGAKFGYLLVWVIVMANLMAMLVQYTSAKLGVATGMSLPELCREHLGRRWSLGLWVQAEAVAMATDLAEFVGAAIGLNLLFGLPLFTAGLITAVGAFGILALQQRGHRKFELAIIGLLFVVMLGFLYDLFAVGPQAPDALAGLVPHLNGADSLLLAVGIIGATVMPHVIYLHSALTQNRVPCADDDEKRVVLRFQQLDVVVAMTVAGLINLSMLCVAAALFNKTGLVDIDSIAAAHAGLGHLVGGGAALAFAFALLASGISSSSVGTYAGQVVMQGFIHRRIPIFVRRAVTMAPSLVVLAIGLSPTNTLVISQVALSFGIPFALVPLLLLTRRRDVMGSFANGRVTNRLLAAIVAVIVSLNVFLIYETLLG
jgi:manganese transport protein